ncbi:transcriptional regulator, TetR family [Lentzea fradiae]|uniref:Transcriptional regulator, TetR family n=1 Tax=Lentzea fradiae TaxID=200378 RepID=A0A1G7NLQ2_9PSEU|nr:TetR/AcrR family transcriptional regulator [Lentzea fradiae]SDF74200.1 transcriptional regulator, TetR family [Lentzea fradiae]
MSGTGRPRGFDADEALHAAMLVFWRQGYEGASLADLTAAMGITKTSMYAAFGNKEELFRKALARYDVGPASYGYRAVEQPTAREVAEAFLTGAVRTTTQPNCPAGCLGVQGSLAAGESGEPAREILVAWRNNGGRMLEERFRRAVEEGDLPEETDAGRLALYVMTVAFGIAVQAASGVSRADLQEVADTALLAWPA